MSKREIIDTTMLGCDESANLNVYSKYNLPLLKVPTDAVFGGASPGSGTVDLTRYVTISKFRPGVVSQYLVTIADSQNSALGLPVTILGADDYGYIELLRFGPKCRWIANGFTSSTQWASGGVAASPAASASLTWGVGTAVASNATLATTMINVSPGTGVSPTAVTLSSSTISTTAPPFTTAATAALTAAAAASSGHIDGTATASSLYLNVAVACTSNGGVFMKGTFIITIIDFGSNTAIRA